MAVLKCKMCGGTLDVQDGMTVCECEYCGSKQTIPTADNEKKMKLFDRANRLRINCEFDKAGSVYESIIEEFPEEAEGYWGNLLCKYGIEYVDDPTTGDKVPTCHRSSFESIMDDEDFELVMENSNTMARGLYREQAKQIEEIRKGIMEVSAHEQPYDIFICYKETDDNGERTLDSVLAQDVYDALTDKGYRVFFSRVSLEDKLGTEYEPYIFAALNSAKIMLAFGTSYDYYNAVWVKNEWGRFLRLMIKDKTKHLIPCFKDIDAYDIPKEFAKLQAQNLGKVGAVQDLLRGIDKLMGRDASSQISASSVQTIIQQVSGSGPNASALIDRGNMSLEDGAFNEAIDFFNRALDIDPKSAGAYLGLFMAGIKVKQRDAAKSVFIVGDYISDRNWYRAKQFATDELADELQTWENERNKRVQKSKWELEEKKRKRQEFEEERRNIRDEIEKLKIQLSTGDFEMSPEERAEQGRLQQIAVELKEEVKRKETALDTSQERREEVRLEKDLRSKEEDIKKLGLFKVKEKKELQFEIDTLRHSLDLVRKKIHGKQREIDRTKQEAEQARKKEKEYKETITSSQASGLKTKIEELNIKLMEMAEYMDTVLFGRYEQGNGIVPIEWFILDREDDRVLLLSKLALEMKVYHEKKEDITWEKCTLRKWLNKDFISKAFTDAECNMIEETECKSPVNPKTAVSPGNATIDKVFVLSIAEVEKYYVTMNDRRCYPTEYVKAAKTFEIVSGGTCWWWLRSPGADNNRCADVIPGGSISYFGESVNSENHCVRPALWVKLCVVDQVGN